MQKHSAGAAPLSTPTWETLEAFARGRIQEFVQVLLEEEVTELLGRAKSARRAAVDAGPGYRNGYGKPRHVALSSGTITVQRPRVRGLEARFESRLLPLFARWTREVGELLPRLYLHGLAHRDFELALRGLLGDGAPLSPSSIARLRAQWQLQRALLTQIPYAPTRAEALARRAAFARRYGRWYSKAVAILEADWERLVTFYAFPQAHWPHLRTTNVVESPFAAVRLRTTAAKRFKQVASATALIWRVLMVAEQRFRRLNAPELLAAVATGQRCVDGQFVSSNRRAIA
jgi:transposase-like protein